MNTSSVKVTYSLDLLTVREVEVMARESGLSKSEVVRRAVHRAAARGDALAPQPKPSKAEALKILQSGPRPSPAELEARMKEVREERRAR